MAYNSFQIDNIIERWKITKKKWDNITPYLASISITLLGTSEKTHSSADVPKERQTPVYNHIRLQTNSFSSLKVQQMVCTVTIRRQHNCHYWMCWYLWTQSTMLDEQSYNPVYINLRSRNWENYMCWPSVWKNFLSIRNAASPNALQD